MAKFLESILMNGYAELGNLSGWSSLGVSIASTKFGKHFLLTDTAYMTQQVASVLFAQPSREYQIKIEYARQQNKDPLEIATDGFINVRFRYASGKEDIVTIPLQSFDTQWHKREEVYILQNEEKLSHIVFEANTKNAIGGILIDNLQLQPSDELLEKEEVGNSYEKFRELSILYGLEADLPELG